MINLEVKNKKGFTLIELLVVISIIGILSTIGLTSFQSSRQKAKRAKAQGEVKELHQILLMYNLDNENDWPTANNITTLAEWNGAWNKYMSVPLDPWGTAYFFDGAPDTECGVGNTAICSAGPNRSFQSFNRADTTAQGDDICIYLEPEC